MTDYFSVRYLEVPPRSTPKYHHDSDAGVSKYHHRSIFRVPELPPRVFEIPIMRFRLRSAEFPCLAGVWGSRSTTTQVTIGTPKYHHEGPEIPLVTRSQRRLTARFT